MNSERRYTLKLSCPDRVGIVARVAGFFAEQQGWILEASQHADEKNGNYFMRVEVRADSLPFHLAELRERFASLAGEFGMSWQISDSAIRKRVVVLVSQQEHCLYDLLGRWKSGELEIDIPCVISNHETWRGLVEWHGIPFHHIPVNRTTASGRLPRSSDCSPSRTQTPWCSHASCRSCRQRCAGAISGAS
jgi:formyltetrahydrofolate deformylase